MDMKKRQLMILTVFVGGLTGSIPVIKAQEWRLMSREEIEAKVHPVLLEQAGEFLHFDTCRLSVGTINEQSQPKTVYFHFQNVSQQTITLNKVTTTCGCTVAGFCKKPLAPNGESIISLTFHPRNRPGTVDAEALVYTNLSDFHLWHDCHYVAMSVRLMNGITCLKIWDIYDLPASRCHSVKQERRPLNA